MKNPNGYGSIINLGKKRRRPYAVRITVGHADSGKQIFKYLSYHAKRSEAILALAEYNKNPYDIDAARITFKEIYDRWTEIEFKDLSDSSIKSYKTAYKYCSPLYNKVFKEIKKDHLQAVIDSIDAPSMAEMTKFLFMKSYKYAIENDIVEKDYSHFVKLPKKPAAKKKIPFTQDEINFIWNNLDSLKYADFFLILIYTGMRISELLEIKKENIHINENYMIGGLKTEAGINRIIPIHKRILPLIEKRMEEKSEWLFTNKRGTQLKYSSFMKYHWPVLIENFEPEHTPHDTRHTFITNMDRLGVNTILTKRIVGHSNTDITEHYTHKSIEELVEAVNKLK